MDSQAILEKLDVKTYYLSEIPSVKWNGKGEGQGLCPFHEDHKKSFSVNQTTGLFFCHACNERGDILSFYMKKHSVDFKTALHEFARISGITETKKTIEAAYDYKDAEGNLVFQTIRYKPKDFKQRRPDSNNHSKWTYNLQGVKTHSL